MMNPINTKPPPGLAPAPTRAPAPHAAPADKKTKWEAVKPGQDNAFAAPRATAPGTGAPATGAPARLKLGGARQNPATGAPPKPNPGAAKPNPAAAAPPQPKLGPPPQRKPPAPPPPKPADQLAKFAAVKPADGADGLQGLGGIKIRKEKDGAGAKLPADFKAKVADACRPPQKAPAPADPYAGISMTADERNACEKAGLSAKHAQLTLSAYHASNIPLNAQTIATRYTPDNIEGNMSPLGKGGLNTVFKATYRDPTESGKTVDLVYKPEPQAGGPVGLVSSLIGIDPAAARYSCRNVAASRTDQFLGWNVMPRTEFAIHAGRVGIVMEMAPGVQPMKSGNWEEDITNSTTGRGLIKHQLVLQRSPETMKNYLKVLGLHSIKFETGFAGATRVIVAHTMPQPEVAKMYRDGVVRRNLVRLQIADFLEAQGDRHALNYFVDPKTGKVTAIDNDQCGGKNVHRRGDMEELLKDTHAWFYVGLPPVIDQETIDDINRLTGTGAREMRAGLQTPEEIDAYVDRLHDLQYYVNNLPPDRIIASTAAAWAKVKFDDGAASYVARDSKIRKNF
jgi:hypothetical protein